MKTAILLCALSVLTFSDVSLAGATCDAGDGCKIKCKKDSCAAMWWWDPKECVTACPLDDDNKSDSRMSSIGNYSLVAKGVSAEEISNLLKSRAVAAKPTAK